MAFARKLSTLTLRPSKPSQADLIDPLYYHQNHHGSDESLILNQRQEDHHYYPDGSNDDDKSKKTKRSSRVREKVKAYWTVVKLKAKMSKL